MMIYHIFLNSQGKSSFYQLRVILKDRIQENVIKSKQYHILEKQSPRGVL